MTRSTYKFLLALLSLWLLLAGDRAWAQEQEVTLRGTVYNMYRTRPLDAVSVISTSGKGTTTDSNGNYTITVRPQDSIYFSYLGRSTVKYPVSTINTFSAFDIALHVDPLELKEVRVMPQNYHMDSIQNRKDYAKIFDFKKPGFKITSPSEGAGVGVDLDELINVFRFNRTRRILSFQHRLEDEEHEKFIDHRFSRYIVKKITRMPDGDLLDSFMQNYRPSYLFCELASDYDFFDYIKLAYQQFKKEQRAKSGEMKQEGP